MIYFARASSGCSIRIVPAAHPGVRSESLPPRPDATAQGRSASSGQWDLQAQNRIATLDRLLQRLHANKPELLIALDRPEIPLHTNGSENDVRCQVTKRKVSGGTRSDVGRDCRDAFLFKTCAKLRIAFWVYLGASSPCPTSPPFRTCPTWSESAALHPDRPGFCPCYPVDDVRVVIMLARR